MARRKLQDSVVVVTGASSGIGRATALAFGDQGAAVVLAARREDALRDLAAEIEGKGARALAVTTDVTDHEAVLSLARQAVQRFGHIDVWVNDAAVTAFGRLEETPPDAYRRVIETNLFGYIYGARAVLPYFREQGGGTLINVSSIVGKMAQPYTSAYVVANFGIIGLAESLRMEALDVPDIHVCTVLPATTDTPLFHQAANYSGRAVTPMPPIYDATEVARAIVSCAQHPQREVYVGGMPATAAAVHTVAPGAFERMYARQVQEKHFLPMAASPTEGNLFSPMPEWAQVSGGFKPSTNHRPARRTTAMIGAAGVAAALVPSLLAVFWLRRRRRTSTARAIASRVMSRKTLAGRVRGARTLAGRFSGQRT